MIDSFNGEYRWLSNFYIEPDGTHVEGEYQGAKFPGYEAGFEDLTPGKAKRLGGSRSMTPYLREDWNDVRIDIMKRLVLLKFLDHPTLYKALVDTGEEELIEGNNWGDTFWGKVNGVGENHLGKILMEVRRKIICNF